MSLNLISSLSLLKSRLEKTQEEKKVKMVTSKSKVGNRLDVRRLNSTDMFGGITESDLDTSSSEDDDDEDDSSDAGSSSPSGFNTPETNHKDEPTQVVISASDLRKYLISTISGYLEEVSGHVEQ